MKDMKAENRTLKRRRLLNSSDEEGVAATVGTIMALLVFLSLLSIITQQYVPVWMEDKEAYHMDEVMMQFSHLKASIDNLVMNEFTDYPLYSYIRLGSEGVPMFASKTPGILRLSQELEGFELSFYDEGSDTDRKYSATGGISLEVLNRYFESQTVIYEHGAILLQQSDRSIIRGVPPIGIDAYDDNFNVRLTMIDIVGAEENIGGTGSVGITTELWSSNRRTVRGDINNLNITLNTRYPDAWVSWLENNTDAPNISVDIAGENLYKITIDMGNNVTEIRYTHARVNMKIST